ncbi:MAG: substrate-binding domain-containing protein [Deltaproteobacteria bacterium]|nr:substrate-binding domain-containing protein [Deltaproteobacteria bacterium]
MRAGLVALLAGLALGAAPAAAGGDSVLLATTTSVRDSGLLGALLPTFSERTGIRVRVVAVGTGAALRLGAEGNADLLLTHAPQAEEELVASGAAASRTPFMENHFVLGGPPEDPAGVRQAASPEEAFRRIAAAQAPYASRADDSGTHKREKALLEAAGLDPAGGWPGFARTGSGMALTLQVAGERRAYVLSDAGTFLAFQEHTGLVALSQPVPALRNVYALLRVSPERFPRVRAEGARKLEAFFLERATQERIAEFGRERFGRPLFRPLLLGPTPAGEHAAPPLAP